MIQLPASGRDWVAAGTLVVGAMVFTGIGVLRLVTDGGGIEVLTLPLALLAADVLIAAALLTGWYPIRPVAQGLAIFGALVHLLVLLRSGPVWTRGCSAVLVGAHVYGLIMLFALTANEEREQLDDDELDDDELDDDEVEVGEATDDGATDDAADPGVVVETPVSEVVDVVRRQDDEERAW